MIPSTRDKTPSKDIAVITNGTMSANGKLRRIVSREHCMSDMSKAMPKIKAMFTTLLPNASPKAICGVPCKAELTETDNSGLDVAKAAMVEATITGEILANSEIPARALTKISPPKPARITPKTSIKSSGTGELILHLTSHEFQCLDPYIRES